ncbi:hypothetical protein Bca4012_066039 [Brassica carinata]
MISPGSFSMSSCGGGSGGRETTPTLKKMRGRLTGSSKRQKIQGLDQSIRQSQILKQDQSRRHRSSTNKA